MFRSFSDKKSPRKSFRLKPPFTRHAISILICAACMLFATLASFLYQHIVPDNHANVALFYILALVIIARWTVGYGYGIVCTLFSVIAINYLFTYPYYKLNFTLTGYPITFLLMSGITLILCTMTSHMTIQSEMIAEREKRLAEAEMEKMRANLLRAISHDLRTPLTAISGNAGILMENASVLDAAKRRQLYTSIYDDSMWLINLVENLLSITRMEGGTMQLNMEGELLEEVIGEAMRHINRKASEHTLSVTQEGDFLLARMDSRLIIQVIINLVDNAIKYTPPGSHIQVRAFRRGDFAVVEIADDGPGIPDSAKERVFDMFYTASNKPADSKRGMGLGLALCRSIVTAHGGQITVSDRIPHGCVFQFTLPIEEVDLHE